jgi:LPXTG-motif cell wall-anchored protein
MKKLFFLLSFLSFTFLFSRGVWALELTKIGTTDLTGKGIGSTVSAYTYNLRSFSLYGLSTASSSVAIKIDDVSYNATANQSGEWSTYLSNLTYDDHTVAISSANQTSLNFTLTISSAAATTTPTATPTVVTSTTSALPKAGSTENTFILLALALLSMGLGVAIKYRA